MGSARERKRKRERREERREEKDRRIESGRERERANLEEIERARGGEIDCS